MTKDTVGRDLGNSYILADNYEALQEHLDNGLTVVCQVTMQKTVGFYRRICSLEKVGDMMYQFDNRGPGIATIFVSQPNTTFAEVMQTYKVKFIPPVIKEQAVEESPTRADVLSEEIDGIKKVYRIKRYRKGQKADFFLGFDAITKEALFTDTDQDPMCYGGGPLTSLLKIDEIRQSPGYEGSPLRAKEDSRWKELLEAEDIVF